MAGEAAEQVDSSGNDRTADHGQIPLEHEVLAQMSRGRHQANKDVGEIELGYGREQRRCGDQRCRMPYLPRRPETGGHCPKNHSNPVGQHRGGHQGRGVCRQRASRMPGFRGTLIRH